MEKLEQTGPTVNDPISGAVLYALDNHQHEDAIFLAERYHAEVQTFYSLWLLASSYYRNGEVQRTMQLLKKNGGLSCPNCVLLYATCCNQLREFDLGLRAMYALVGGNKDEKLYKSTLHRPLFFTESRISEEVVVSLFKGNAGLAFQLLGQLNRFDSCQAPSIAAMCFKLSLKHNPYLWTSFKALCELGEKIDPQEYFDGSKCPSFSCQSKQHWTSTNSIPASQQAGKVGATGLKGAATQGEIPMSTPDLFFNPVMGTARASSTPRLGELPAFKLFSGGSGQQSNSGAPQGRIASTPLPSTPFAWSLPTATPAPASSPPGPASSVTGQPTSNPRLATGKPSLLRSTRTTLRFTPEPTTDSPHTTAAAPSPSMPVTDAYPPGMACPKSVPSIARVAWSQSSGREWQREMLPAAPHLPVAPLVGGLFSTPDQGEMGDEDDSVGASTSVMPPPKAPVKSSMAPLRRSARIGSFTTRGGSPPTFRRRTLATSGRFGSPSGHRPERLRSSPTRRSPRKSTSADDVQNIGVGSAMRRSLLFGSKSTHSMPQDTTTQDHTEVCASQQQQQPEEEEEESAGVEREEEEGKASPVEEGADVDEVMQASVNGLMSLLCRLAMAYQCLTSYELAQCVKCLQVLPQTHLQTSWVQTCLAKAYLFTGRYKKAAEMFASIHLHDPHRQEGMDYYSSALWQLNQVVTLEVLAEEMRWSDPNRPEGWCVLGNVKSRYKDNSAAIKCFQKAAELAPSYAYAHTLLGIEYSVADEQDRALASLKTAIACNPRMFQAWFAMGMVYDSQEKHELAAVQYKKAFAINKQSALVCCQLGLCLSRLNKPREGLELIDLAIKLDPKMPVARFNKAVTLTAAGQLEGGLEELKTLSKLVPKEAKVYIQMAKLLHMLDRDQEAIQQLSLALNCDRENITIRQEIDRLLQVQGAATRGGPDMSLSAHHDAFEALEEDDDDDNVADDEDPMGMGPDDVSSDDNADSNMEA